MNIFNPVRSHAEKEVSEDMELAHLKNIYSGAHAHALRQARSGFKGTKRE